VFIFFFQAEDGIRDRNVTGVQTCALPISDNHLITGPDGRVRVPWEWRVGDASGCPTIRARIVSPAGVKLIVATQRSSPDNHFTASPDGRVRVASGWRISGARRCPTIHARIVSPAGVRIPGAIIST